MFLKKIRHKILSEKDCRQIILMYHHINSPNIDPWEMSVHPGNFKDHLEILSADYTVLPLSSLAAKKNIPSKKNIVYITFDDGYLDNYETAYPLLQQYRMPATFFIPTKIFSKDFIFWWEVLEHVLLGTTETPDVLKLVINNEEKEWILNKKNNLEQNKNFSAWNEVAENIHQKIYLTLGEIIKYCKPAEQESVKQQLIKWAGNDVYSNEMNKMNEAQLKKIYAENLIEIGAHTVNHPALGNLTEKEQTFEIKEGKIKLEKILSAEIKSFAYPHGHYTSATKKIVRNESFIFACTADENSFTVNDDMRELPRIWIKNWDKKTFSNYLQGLF